MYIKSTSFDKIRRQLKGDEKLTTFVWTIPGDTHNTLMPDSAGSRF